VARIEKVLVANRGEIARRVLRTLRAMGLESVAVYSDADADAAHVAEADEAVRIGPAPARESYLAVDRILDAARTVAADALHPGYGFLSENAELARRCAEAGLVFIGPPADAVRRMGNKVEAKAIMAAAGVPVIPGASGDSDDRLLAEARRIGFPVLVKAAAGGGGKGMRIVHDAGALPGALAAARREAGAAFGDDSLLLERYLAGARHIEVQVMGDTLGTVVHCFERECSIQRRYQKIIEEAPSVAVDADLRGRMGTAAVTAARAIGYSGAGTVEFLVDDRREFYFLEMNTRLQVEHPVTEAVTGLDLVELQILVAGGAPLPFAQEDLRLDGHAIEARLYAEDPAQGFLPATGRVSLWAPAPLPGVRYDSGVVSGSVVGVHYDPLLAKVIAHGRTREEATRRLHAALERLGVAGVTTNRTFLMAVLRHPAFVAGEIDTNFVEQHFPPAGSTRTTESGVEGGRDDLRGRTRLHAIVAALHGHEHRRALSPLPPSIPSGWRNNRWRAQDVTYRAGAAGDVTVHYVATGRAEREASFEVRLDADERLLAVRIVARERDAIAVEIDGVRRRFQVVADEATGGSTTVVHGALGTTELVEVPRLPPRRADQLAGGCLAPMTGVVREIRVAVGDSVEAGAVMLVLEAMKMEHEMVAHTAGVVTEVRVEVGQMVDPDTVLVVVEPAEAP
jgi:acetyl-CoA carboxylase biotin carboxylase subunit